jgi:hypothetical protein
MMLMGERVILPIGYYFYIKKILCLTIVVIKLLNNIEVTLLDYGVEVFFDGKKYRFFTP